MPNRLEFTADEWETFYRLLRLNRRVYVGLVEQCRCFLNGVLWILRSGGQWRLSPVSLGKWNSVLKRFSRGCERGRSLYENYSRHPDLQQVLIDSTITHAHACAEGVAGSSTEAGTLGRSKGGYTTKIHAITDDLGNPLDFILTGGPASNIG